VEPEPLAQGLELLRRGGEVEEERRAGPAQLAAALTRHARLEADRPEHALAPPATTAARTVARVARRLAPRHARGLRLPPAAALACAAAAFAVVARCAPPPRPGGAVGGAAAPSAAPAPAGPREALARFADALDAGRWEEAWPLLSARWRARTTPALLAQDLTAAGPVGRAALARVRALLAAGAPVEADGGDAAALRVGDGRVARLVREPGGWRVDALE
jgi:hypothetical protein